MSFDLLVFLACILGGAFFAFQFYQNSARPYREKQARLQKEIEKLEAVRGRLQETLEATRESIRAKREAIHSHCGHAPETQNTPESPADADTPAAPPKPPPTAKTPPRPKVKLSDLPVEERLVHKKILTPTQLEKARNYKVKTNSDMDIIQILLMFDYVNPQQLKAVEWE